MATGEKVQVVHIVESLATGVLDIVEAIVRGEPGIQHTIAYWQRPETPDDLETRLGGYATLQKIGNSDGRFSPLNEVRGVWEFLKAARSIPKDAVVHLHSTKAGIWARIGFAIRFDFRRVIYTPHAAAFLRKDIGKIIPLAVSIVERLLTTIVPTTIVCCSGSEAEEYHRRGMSARFIYNGLPYRGRNATKGDRIIVAGSGRLSPQKGGVLFAKIAEDCTGSNLSFAWIGDGPERSVLGTHVHVTGWLKPDEVLDALDGASIFMSTSEWEGLSISVLQAMRNGLPLILRRCVGNVDLVRDGVNGYLFDTDQEAADMLLRLANDVHLREQMGQESLNLFRELFTVEAMCLSYSSLYHRHGAGDFEE